MMKTIEKYYSYLISAAAFAVYLITMAPSVVQIDSGELATVQVTLGIAHPTGYPLFTIAGHLFSLLPLPLSKIASLNLLAAIWTALGIFAFIKTAEIIISIACADKKADILLNKNLQIIFISGGALSLAFSRTYWLQSTSVEVYSLQIFIFSLILWATVNSYEKLVNKQSINWLIIALLLAVGFANHMTTLLLLPGIAFLFFKAEGFGKRAFVKIGKMLSLFFPLLILFYSYLPFRAVSKPILNWGNAINFENFWRHFTGKQYQVWLFASVDAAKKQLAYFVSNIGNEFTYLGILLALMGMFFLLKKSKPLFTFLIINFLFTIIYSINYDINDIDSYFLLAYINFSIFVIFGFYQSFIIVNKIKRQSIAAAIVSLLLVGYIFIDNFNAADQSDVYMFEDYTKAAISSLPENSILFTYQWDYLVSPSYYFQYVENFRRDVAVIDKELLRRSWYYEQLGRNFPGLLDKLKPETKGFLKALKPFERSENFNAKLLENYYRAIMSKLISANIERHPYFIAPELVDNEMRRNEFILPPGMTIVPHLFFFEVVKRNEYVEAPLPNFTLRDSKFGNKYTAMIKNIVAQMLTRRALYELSFNKIERAKIYTAKIRTDFPGFRIPVKLRNL